MYSLRGRSGVGVGRSDLAVWYSTVKSRGVTSGIEYLCYENIQLPTLVLPHPDTRSTGNLGHPAFGGEHC